MSCVGKELVGDAARIPIVDTVEGHDLLTNAAVLKVGACSLITVQNTHAVLNI